MRKNFAKMMVLALIAIPFGMALPAQAATTWDVSGTYEWLVMGTYAHDMTLVMNPDGTFTGTGGYPAGNAPYTNPGETGELITNGVVSGNNISFTLTYTGPFSPGSTWNFSGTIAPDGSMSGVSPMEWQTTSGLALAGALSAEDFGVVDYDTGVTGQLSGYTAGFGLTDATLADTTSVVVKLYSGTTLLQTNTAIMPAFSALSGSQFSAPFDVSGGFDYVLDGYWTNAREAQYGQSMPATKVVATVTLANGKVVTATNMNLVGDPTTIYPEEVVVNNPTTNPVTGITSTNATLNGTNGDSNAIGSSFWVSLNTFSTASPSIPEGVYSTIDLGLVTANTSFSALLSSATGMPAVTPNTMYYFVAWSNVDGTWYPGEILTFTTASVTPPPATAPSTKDDCKKGGWMTFTNPSFKNQGQCVSSVVSNR